MGVTRRATWTDEEGRRWHVLLPAGAPDEEAPHGLLLGPPDLSELGLPPEIEIRLHRALEARGLITAEDARRRPQDITAALQSAFRVSAQRVQALYLSPP